MGGRTRRGRRKQLGRRGDAGKGSAQAQTCMPCIRVSVIAQPLDTIAPSLTTKAPVDSDPLWSQTRRTNCQSECQSRCAICCRAQTRQSLVLSSPGACRRSDGGGGPGGRRQEAGGRAHHEVAARDRRQHRQDGGAGRRQPRARFPAARRLSPLRGAAARCMGSTGPWVPSVLRQHCSSDVKEELFMNRHGLGRRRAVPSFGRITVASIFCER